MHSLRSPHETIIFPEWFLEFTSFLFFFKCSWKSIILLCFLKQRFLVSLLHYFIVKIEQIIINMIARNRKAYTFTESNSFFIFIVMEWCVCAGLDLQFQLNSYVTLSHSSVVRQSHLFAHPLSDLLSLSLSLSDTLEQNCPWVTPHCGTTGWCTVQDMTIFSTPCLALNCCLSES